MGSNGNNSVIIVSELYEALKSRQPKKIMMDGLFIILMTTKYGKVEVTTDYVIFPGNECRYYREGKNVDEYCSFIFDNLDSLSMPLRKVEEVFNEISGNGPKVIHSKENKIRGFLRIITSYGNLYFNGNYVKFPGNDKIYSRKKRSLRTFCTFIINGISKYSRENSGEKLDEILSVKYDLDTVCIKKPVMEINERKFVTRGGEWHINTRYGKVVTDGNSVRFPGNPNDYYRKKSIEKFAGFIADNIDKLSDIHRNVITETADDDKIGKEFDRIHSEWSAFNNHERKIRAMLYTKR